MAGGLRVSEVAALRWRDVNLASGWLCVEDSKTEAGIRTVDLEPDLLDELKAHKAASVRSEPSDHVFPGKDGQRRDRSAITRRVLHPAIKRANNRLTEAGRSAIPDGVTFHSLRRTFAALKAEAGEHPAVTAAQIGHKDHRFTLNVYTDVRNRRAQVHIGGLLRGVEWAAMGSEGDEAASRPADSVARESEETAQEQAV
jgi:integrase